MKKEGLSNIFARHIRVGKATRKGIKDLGLKLFADESSASNTVTAVNPPQNLDPDALRRIIREKYKVVLSGGQQDLTGKIFRIGHLGLVNTEDINITISSIGKGLSDMGFRI